MTKPSASAPADPGGIRASGPWARLALWGTFAFAAFSPLSIAASQICWGIACFGLLGGLLTRRIRYRPTPLDLPLVLFVVAEAVSIVFSVHPGRSLRVWDGDWILIFFPVFAQSLRSVRDVRRALSILLISSSLTAAYAIWQVAAGRDLIRARGLEPLGDWFIATGAFGHHLTYGGHILITATLAFALLLGRLRGGDLPWRIATFVLQASGLVASFARTAWIGFLAGAAALAVFGRGWARRMAVAAIGFAAAAAFLLPAIRHRLGDLAAYGDDPRVRLWHTALRIWRDHPIVGAGLGSYKTLFPTYKVPGEYMAHGHPHNDALNILVHSGILGLAAFAFIFVRYFRMIGGARARLVAEDPRRPLLLAAILVPIAFFVGGLGQCFLTDEEVGMLFWFVVAAFVATAREVLDARA